MGVNSKVTRVQHKTFSYGKAISKMKVNIAVGILNCAKIIKHQSDIYVPVDTKALKNSGRIEVTGKGIVAKANVIYGSAEAYYAGYVHEQLDKHHEEPTCAKYLEKASRETVDLQRIAMQRAVKGETTVTYGEETFPT